MALRHARDAFRGPEFIAASWRPLGYHDAPDFERAVAEYDAFAALLQSAGAAVEYLPGDDSLTLDSIYVRDASVMTPDGLVATRMGKIARRSESAVDDRHYRTLDLAGTRGVAAGILEGGDMVWFDESTCAVGEGYRTDPAGIAALRALLDEHVELAVCPLPHYRGAGDVFHLMSILSPLDRDLALVHSRLMAVRFRRWLASRGVTLVEVADGEFERMGCNVLALGPRRCLMLEGLPETRRRLERAGCEVLTYRGEEISRKGEGGPTCLTRPLERAGS